MYPVWKEEMIGKHYRKARLKEAEHERLVQLALRNFTPRNTVQELWANAIKFVRSVRLVSNRRYSGDFDEGNIAIEYE